VQGPGANGGGKICNGTQDATNDATYTCSEAHIDSIATAHCSIAANNKPSADLTALRSGNYANIPSGPCGATCPSECACDSSNHCVAPWLGTASGGSGGASSGGGSGVAGAGGASNSGGGNGVTSNGGTGTSGGATASAGATSTSGGATPSCGGALGTAGTSSSAGSGDVAGSSDGSTNDSKGCSCRAAGQSRNHSLAGLLLASAFAGLTVARARVRRRSKG
jgi:hypothetical protein